MCMHVYPLHFMSSVQHWSAGCCACANVVCDILSAQYGPKV